jgi:hypothetical protein
MTDPHAQFLAELDVMIHRAQELCPPIAVALTVMLAAHYAGVEEQFKMVCLEFGADLQDQIDALQEEEQCTMHHAGKKQK